MREYPTTLAAVSPPAQIHGVALEPGFSVEYTPPRKTAEVNAVDVWAEGKERRAYSVIFFSAGISGSSLYTNGRVRVTIDLSMKVRPPWSTWASPYISPMRSGSSFPSELSISVSGAASIVYRRTSLTVRDEVE